MNIINQSETEEAVTNSTLNNNSNNNNNSNSNNKKIVEEKSPNSNSNISSGDENNNNNNNKNNNKIKKNKKLKEKDMDSIVKQYSGDFDSWMAVQHLYKYRNNPGIIDFLCNKLYNLEDKDIDFYITQLCILLINQPYDQKASFSSLARFVLDRCAISVRFAIKAYWIFQAFEEDGEKNLFSIENSVYLQSPSETPKDVPMYSNEQIIPIDLDKIYNQNQYDEEEFIDDSSNNGSDSDNNNNNNGNKNSNNSNSNNDSPNSINQNPLSDDEVIDEEFIIGEKENNSNNNDIDIEKQQLEDDQNNITSKTNENNKENSSVVSINNENVDSNNTIKRSSTPTPTPLSDTTTKTPTTTPNSITTSTSTIQPTATSATIPTVTGGDNFNYTIDGINQPYISQPNDPIENITQILKRNRKIYNKIEAKKELATRLREFCEMSVITCSRPLITRPRTSSLPSPIINFNNNNNKSNLPSPNNNSDNMDSTSISEQQDICNNDISNLSEDEISNYEKQCKTPPVESKLSDQDFEFELSKSYRCDYLNDILSFIQKMARISKILLPIAIDLRQAKLKHEISLLNINLPLGLYIPLWQNSNHHCVVRIPPEEVKILNSRDRVPFLLVLEILESDKEALSSNIFEVVSSYLQYTTTNDSLLKMNEMKRKYFSYIKNFLNTSNESTPTPSSSSSTLTSSNATASTTTTTATTTNNSNSNATSKSLPTSPNNSINNSSNNISSSASSAIQRPIGIAGNVSTNLSTSPLSSPMVEKILNDSSRSSSPFGESWAEKTERYRRISPYGHFPNWKLCSVIVKTGDDCRQEQMAVQLIRKFDEIWKSSRLPLYLRPYNILVTSSSGGIIETIPDTISLHNLKKNTPNFTTLFNYFKSTYGEPSTLEFRTAQSNFIESMAAYSIVTYILQIKDRHNGNILIDKEGHIVHIDFGYILSNSPGNISFESAPFKLTQELVDVMGGVNSAPFQYFKVLCVRGLIEARKQVIKILSLIEIMMSGPKMSCFVGGKEVIEQLKSRFFLDVNERECSTLVENLISYSIDHFKTRYYDKYQSWYNGILP